MNETLICPTGIQHTYPLSFKIDQKISESNFWKE